MSIDRSYLQRFDVRESQTIKCYKEVGWNCLAGNAGNTDSPDCGKHSDRDIWTY
jgi:hypothetical protein